MMDPEAFCQEPDVKKYNLYVKYGEENMVSCDGEEGVKIEWKSVKVARQAKERVGLIEKTREAASREAAHAIRFARNAKKVADAAQASADKACGRRDELERKRKFAQGEWERAERLRVHDEREREQEANQAFHPCFHLPPEVMKFQPRQRAAEDGS